MVLNPRKKARALIVEDHSCSCGNRWTHSYTILTDESFSFWGGTPFGDETLLPLVIIAPRSAMKQNGCMRCCTAPIWTPDFRSTSQKENTSPNHNEPDDLLNL